MTPARALFWIILGLAGFALATCNQSDWQQDAQAYQQRIEAISGAPLGPVKSVEEKALDDEIFALASSFDGLVGVAIHDIARRRTVHFNGDRLLPQQSLSKLWVTLAALQKVDGGELDLAERASVRFGDLTVFHQPVRKIVLAQGAFNTTYGDLMRRAITESDNTANDMLLKRVGGPSGVRNAIEKARLGDVKFGPGEIPMQSALAGLEWNATYSLGENFFHARKRVPADERKSIFDAYVEDPIDGASPRAIAVALAKLARGELLEPPTTALFEQLLVDVKSGRNRLKGGVPEGWSIGHKTGTGQVLDIVPPGVIGDQTGYNDVGILTAPDGKRYSVAVMIGRTATPVPERMEFMHRVVQAIVRYHYAAKGEAVPAQMLPVEEI